MAMRVLFVGDTHGDTRWWQNAVQPMASLLGVDIVIQVGDFGWWPDSGFIELVASGPRPVYFIDGNHEHHTDLKAAVAKYHAHIGSRAPVALEGCLCWIPRGGHMEFGGVRVAFMGGAHSIDRGLRTAGVDWFPDEAIEVDDLIRLDRGGRVDLLVTHDAPFGYKVPGMWPIEGMPEPWQSELVAAEQHRKLILTAVDLVQPKALIHGHYHSRYSFRLPTDYGEVQIQGLNQSGTGSDNFLVVDFRDGTMTFTEPIEAWATMSSSEVKAGWRR